jgi:hypothetical protein
MVQCAIFPWLSSDREAIVEYADYLREEAARLRQSAELAQEPAVVDELRELAAICERVAAELEDRMLAG